MCRMEKDAKDTPAGRSRILSIFKIQHILIQIKNPDSNKKN